MKLINIWAAAAIIAGSFAGAAVAQFNNKPYSFPGGGPGMSVAARQAIIIHEIKSDFSPNFLLRGPAGGLLTVTPSPKDNNMPLVRAADGTLIPSYHRGHDRTAAPSLGAGIFNPFFAGSGGGGSYGVYPAAYASDSISVWTGRVINAISFAPTGDSINDWTAAAYLVGPAH